MGKSFHAALCVVATLSAAAGAGQAAAEAETSVEELVVTARAQALYREGEVTVGKMPTEPLSSSQAVQVINEELIRDQGARDAQDLYRNIASVSFFSYAGVTARGFRQEEIFFDNLRGDPYAGFTAPQLFNIERVEFLKGPAGMLYGPGAPGGLFNYVTKKPSEEFSARAAGVLGTEGRWGASAEVTGALPLEGASARIGVFYEDQSTPRRGAANEVTILDAGLKFDVGIGDLVLQATRYKQNLPANRLRGVPVDNLGNFIADRRWNHNEPTDFLNFEGDVLQASLTAEPTDSLSLNVAARYSEGGEAQQYHEPQGFFDSDGDGAVDMTQRQFRDQIRNQSNWSVGANGVWSGDIAGVQSRVLFGADWFTNEQTLDNRNAAQTRVPLPGRPPPLSLLNPV